MARAMHRLSAKGIERTKQPGLHADGGGLNNTYFDYERHLCPQFDWAFTALIQDLEQRGLLQETVVAAVASAPDSSTPLEAAVAGIEAAGVLLEERRGQRFARQRQSIIAGSAELRERELHKLSALAAAVADALRERGVSDPGASLLAEVATAIFRISFERWVSESGAPELPELMRESLAELRELAARVPLGSGRP